MLALIVSGGHSQLVLFRDHGDYELLGQTQDDAVGEAFDKVAKIIGLPYPGGPAIAKAALEGDPHTYPLPKAKVQGVYDFSFSGLKTAVLHAVEQQAAPPAEIAWAFEESVCDVLSSKALRAAEREGARALLVAGGVAANGRLRERLEERAAQAGLPLFIPPAHLCTDNAAMIAAAAFRHLDDAVDASEPLDVVPTASRYRALDARRGAV